MWFCNRLASKGEKHYWLPTKIMKKKLPTTDRKNINWLPTWTDIIDICFHKEELALSIFSSLVSNHIKYMTYQMVLLCCYVYISCYKQYQNHESHILKNTELIIIFKKKTVKIKTFRWTSQVMANTPKNEGFEIVCSVNENFYKDNTLPARNA